jgi:beta-galactosidase
LTTLQESQATGYPTDVPTKSYDFQAPMSAFGAERASFRKLKVFHYFLNEFGGGLAPMPVYSPSKVPKSPGDFSVLRASVRSDGQHGFLFVNNYVRGARMPVRKDVQFQVLLPHSELRMPQKPIDVPSGAYFIWPFNFSLGDLTLEYATAQLFTRITERDRDTYFFAETPGIPAEFVIKKAPGLSVVADGALVEEHKDDFAISKVPIGLNHGIQIRRGNGREIRVLLLSGREAESAWKIDIDGSAHLLETEQDFFPDGQSIVLQTDGEARCAFTLFPATHLALRVASGKLEMLESGEIARYTGSVPEEHLAAKIEKIKEAAEVPPVKLGPPLSWRPQGVAMAPDDSAFDSAAKWTISIPRKVHSTAVSNLFLEITYTGDVARLSAKGHLLDDNFYNGLPWTVGLERFHTILDDGSMELSILPLRKDAPLFIEKEFRPDFGSSNQIVDVKSARVIPQYKFRIER